MAGTCHRRSLTDDTKHQVALNTYELNVFSIAVLGGGLAPQPKTGGSGGQRPPAKNISQNFEKKNKIVFLFFWFFRFWLGGAAPKDLHFLEEGGEATPDLQWKTHPVHKY